MTAVQLISMGMLSGLASVDRLAGMNIMLSRPLVVAGIVGYTFDKLIFCLMLGAIFEFVGMVEVPVGTTITDDDTFAGYAISMLVASGIASHDAVSLLLCVSFTVVMMYPVTMTDLFCRMFNKELIGKNINSKNVDFESRLIIYGLIIAFLRGVIVYNLALAIIVVTVLIIGKVHGSEYAPYASIILLSTFMGGYLIRFLSVNNLLKIGLLVGGVVFGWYFV